MDLVPVPNQRARRTPGTRPIPATREAGLSRDMTFSTRSDRSVRFVGSNL